MGDSSADAVQALLENLYVAVVSGEYGLAQSIVEKGASRAHPGAAYAL